MWKKENQRKGDFLVNDSDKECLALSHFIFTNQK